MQTNSLLYGLIGFFLGGLLVAIAATSLDKPQQAQTADSSSMSSMSMDSMTAMLENKTGDDFDQAFIESMIVHHEGAVAMAKLSAANAKHAEIKILSENIISAQKKEIAQMKQWQMEWDYTETMNNHTMHQ
jgi:uncharacterized protein (DUF305 family)